MEELRPDLLPVSTSTTTAGTPDPTTTATTHPARGPGGGSGGGAGTTVNLCKDPPPPPLYKPLKEHTSLCSHVMLCCGAAVLILASRGASGLHRVLILSYNNHVRRPGLASLRPLIPVPADLFMYTAKPAQDTPCLPHSLLFDGLHSCENSCR
ncbi:hypothetical protein E2C01_022556 [Portunus trituberculatus]|uniref:Uncharacterized protein n=1 Tax=Portunus trituberculatus TaxID=210409 RepID=A0A5B7E6A9_PORTR|nr:hypothetical protein [Portunus trituberculatus]